MALLPSPISDTCLAIPFLFAENFNVRSNFIKEMQTRFLKEVFKWDSSV